MASKKKLPRAIHRILGEKRFSHLGTLYGVAYSPDGSILASSSFDESVKWHDAETGELIKSFHIGSPWLHGLAFSPDGTMFGCGSKTLRIYSVPDGKKLHSLKGHKHDVHDVAFSPDSKLFATVSGSSWIPADYTLRLWDTATGKCLHKLAHASAVKAVVFHPNNEEVITCTSGSTATVWDIASGKQIRSFQVRDIAGDIHSIAISPDGRMMAAGGSESIAYLLDVESGTITARLFGSTIEESPASRGYSSILDVIFSADNKRLYVSRGFHGEDCVHVWDIEERRELKRYDAQDPLGFTYIALSPDETRMFAGSSDAVLSLCDLQNNELLLTTPPSHTECVSFLAYDATGKTVASAARRASIRIWDLESATQRKAFDFKQQGTWISHDKTHLYTVDDNFGLHKINLATLEHQRIHEKAFDLDRWDTYPHLSHYLPEEDLLLLKTSGSEKDEENGILWYDCKKREPLPKETFSPSTYYPILAMAPDAKHYAIAIGYEDKNIYLFDRKTRTLQMTFTPQLEEKDSYFDRWSGVYGMDFSPDGTRIAAISDNLDICVWDVASGEQLLTGGAYQRPGSYGGWDHHQLAYSPNGKFIVAAYRTDKTIRVFDANTLEEVKKLKRHTKEAEVIAVAPDSKTFATAGEDLAVVVWHTPKPKKAKKKAS